MVADVASVLDQAGVQAPVLIGASMGGITSLVAIGEKHFPAKALILVDIVPRTEPEGVDKIRAFMAQRPDGFATLEEVADAIGNYQPQRVRRRNLDGLAKNIRLGSDGRYHWHWDPAFRAGTGPDAGRLERCLACARALDVPTLLVRGAMSDVVSDAGVAEFRQLCPGSEFVDVSDAGHMVAGDRNDVFGRAAMGFLQRVAPPSGLIEGGA